MKNVRRKINKNRVIILILICLFFIGITSKTWSYFEEQKQIKLEQERKEEEKT